MPGRATRTVLLASAALTLAALALAVALVCMLLYFGPAQRDEPPPSAAELRRHWQASLRWMREHDSQVMADGNAMLWRMVRDAAVMSGDAGLAQQVQRHRERYFSREPVDAWVLLLDPAATPRSTRPIGLDALPAYMKLFAYGMTCDSALGTTPVVQLQRGPAWCSAFAVRRVLQQQKCVTHQLMGFMLMQQRHCGDAAQVAAVTRQLQDRVVDELALDFVVRDEHLQRLLMLYWTGAPERVKPVWLNRALRAQRPDGGWDYESAYARWPAPADATAPADFHATAQGLLILALALRQAETPVR